VGRCGATRCASARRSAIAEELAAAVSERADDPRLKWAKDRSSFRLLITATNPDGAPKQTLKGRSKRLREALKPLLAEIGWHPPANQGSTGQVRHRRDHAVDRRKPTGMQE